MIGGIAILPIISQCAGCVYVTTLQNGVIKNIVQNFSFAHISHSLQAYTVVGDRRGRNYLTRFSAGIKHCHLLENHNV